MMAVTDPIGETTEISIPIIPVNEKSLSMANEKSPIVANENLPVLFKLN